MLKTWRFFTLRKWDHSYLCLSVFLLFTISGSLCPTKLCSTSGSELWSGKIGGQQEAVCCALNTLMTAVSDIMPHKLVWKKMLCPQFSTFLNICNRRRSKHVGFWWGHLLPRILVMKLPVRQQNQQLWAFIIQTRTQLRKSTTMGCCPALWASRGSTTFCWAAKDDLKKHWENEWRWCDVDWLGTSQGWRPWRTS